MQFKLPKFILPCWLVGHTWSDWRHDPGYIQEAPAFIRTCGREHRYDNKRKRWIGHVHAQREFRWEDSKRPLRY